MAGDRAEGGQSIVAGPGGNALARMAEVVGPAHAIADSERKLPYLRELRGLYAGSAALVLRPGSTREVAQILAIAHEAGIGIVPQGGNTGLVGGQIPTPDGRQVVLSLSRLNKVREVDTAGGTMIVEAGVTLAAARTAAERADRLFPLSLPSEGSCQIGGVLATNAGGVSVLAYGNARALTLGLEVVTADGQVWDGLRTLKKDNTGYDLRDLIVGSEGTLGIITAAALKLFPRPAETAVALAALPDIESVAALFRLAEGRGHAGLTAFEFMSRFALDLVSKHIPNTRLPLLAPAPWYVLIEIASAEPDGLAESTMQRLLTEAADDSWYPTLSSLGRWRKRKRCGGCAKPLLRRSGPRAEASSTMSRCRSLASPSFSPRRARPLSACVLARDRSCSAISATVTCTTTSRSQPVWTKLRTSPCGDRCRKRYTMWSPASAGRSPPSTASDR